MIKVRWFANGHEHRNYWLRYGFMRLHRAGRIRYREYPLSACTRSGFADEVALTEHRHTSVFTVEDGSHAVRCIVDSEDSFFQLTPLVRHADLYFIAGYNATFFEDQRFAPPYAWLEPHEYRRYADKAAELSAAFGDCFARVRPFVPIGPSLLGPLPALPVSRRMLNAHHKLRSKLHDSQPWLVPYMEFEARYRRLLALREAPLASDVVLLDTAWGWPRHRYALHRRLKALAATRKIHARLKWYPPYEMDGSAEAPLAENLFPVETGRVSDYEPMLAGSRLGVFATGLHFGWRNIMTLALMWGLPVHMDRPLLEPWFDMGRFEITWNEDAGWPALEERLGAITDAEWRRIKAHNQAAFDDVLTPDRAADYVIATVFEGRPSYDSLSRV